MIHGAKWWKFDVHTHTPKSGDWRGPEGDHFSPEEWLLGHMRQGVDCVAVTDHNSGEWVDTLKEANARMAARPPEGFRPLVIFPGAEISVNGGVHLLAVFDPAETSQRIARLLSEMGFRGDFGDTQHCTEKPFRDVVAAILAHGGIPIPAHVCDASGLFAVQGRPGQGPTLEQSLASHGLLAMELTDSKSELPELYRESGLRLSELVGSDSHRPEEAGRRFTWVKMEEPVIAALRLALHDGQDGVQRGDTQPENPNDLRDRLFISRLSVTNGAKAGQGAPLDVRFSPWMTSIIGGRGAGKSSIVHFLRYGLNKTKDLPESARSDFESFRQVAVGRGRPGMLRDQTEVRIELQRDNRLIALTRTSSGWTEEEYSPELQRWTLVGTPDRPEDRFPIQIFSQKQLYELTDDSRALLNILDEASGRSRLSEQRRELEAAWLASRRRERELVGRKRELQNLTSERNDIAARLQSMEESGQKDVLANYRAKQHLDQALVARAAVFDEFSKAVAAQAASAPEFKVRDEARTELGLESSSVLDAIALKWGIAVADLRGAAERLAALVQELREAIPALPWRAEYEKAVREFEALARAGAPEPSSFDTLVAKRSELDQKISEAEAAARLHDEQSAESERLRLAILAVERELRARRKAVVAEWNTTVLDQGLSVTLDPLANFEEGERTLRELLRKPTEFGRVLLELDPDERPSAGFLATIANAPSEEERWQQAEHVTSTICAASESDIPGVDRKFSRHVQQLRQQTPEDLDRIRIWVPEDRLLLKLVRDGKEEPIEAGSAGQRTAGMLALLMARGKGPLVIDQPEDDLDTRRISEQVVRGLRALKRKQQVVVVTHNPNIPVNGAAEQIVEMHFARGQIRQRCSGALQRIDVRSAVCEVMEGGREALENRYYRISRALAAKHDARDRARTQ